LTDANASPQHFNFGWKNKLEMGSVMKFNKKWLIVIGSVMVFWTMNCRLAECERNETSIKDILTWEDSNLTLSKQSRFNALKVADSKRFSKNGSDNSITGDRLTLESVRNAEYRSKYYEDGPVRLNNGRHETKIDPDSDMKAFIELTDKIAFGDLNGDGNPDAAVILLSSGGGSGGFFELAAMINQNGKPQQAAMQYLGDRVDIKSIAIKSGIIVVDMLTHGPNDPQCCPTVRKTQRYRLDGGRLVRVQ
jgi:hypothetical protein